MQKIDFRSLEDIEQLCSFHRFIFFLRKKQPTIIVFEILSNYHEDFFFEHVLLRNKIV